MKLINNLNIVRKNILANNIGNAYNALTLFIVIPIYIKYLGIESFSVIALFTIISSWAILLDFGFKSTVERKFSRFKANELSIKSVAIFLRSVEIFILVIGVLVIALIWMLSDWLAVNWASESNLLIREVKKSFVLMGFIIALRTIEAIYNKILVALQKQVLQNTISIVLVSKSSAPHLS